MSSPELRIAHETVGQAQVVHVSGEIDLATAPDLRASLLQAAGKAQSPEVVVADLDAVTFMGSAGIAVLIELDGHCRERHTPLRIVVGSRAVARSLEATGLDRVLDIAGSLDSALRIA